MRQRFGMVPTGGGNFIYRWIRKVFTAIPVIEIDDQTGALYSGGQVVQAASSGTPGGSDTQVQFNDGGILGGNSALTIDKNSGQVGFGANIPVSTSPVTLSGGDDGAGDAALVVDSNDGYVVVNFPSHTDFFLNRAFFNLLSPFGFGIGFPSSAPSSDGGSINLEAQATTDIASNGGTITMRGGSALGGGGAVLALTGGFPGAPGEILMQDGQGNTVTLGEIPRLVLNILRGGYAGAATALNFEGFNSTDFSIIVQGGQNVMGPHTTQVGQLQVTAPSVPANASSAGIAGTIAWDTGFVYVCVSTNTWKRVAISTW